MHIHSDVFPLSDQSSDRSMDLDMVRQLAMSGGAIAAKELTTMASSHALFLNHGGGGGSWQMLSVSGLPMCIYMGPTPSQGEQIVLRLKNIQNASLRSAQLDFSDMSGAYAQGAVFSGSTMTHVMAIDSIFDGADFSGCDLTSTDFSGASLKGASFKGADLTGADFECADLTGADFSGAQLIGARFPGACLDDVAMP